MTKPYSMMLDNNMEFFTVMIIEKMQASKIPAKGILIPLCWKKGANDVTNQHPIKFVSRSIKSDLLDFVRFRFSSSKQKLEMKQKFRTETNRNENRSFRELPKNSYGCKMFSYFSQHGLVLYKTHNRAFLWWPLAMDYKEIFRNALTNRLSTHPDTSQKSTVSVA